MGKLLINGKLYNPIKVGDKGDWYEGQADAKCGDCGAEYGEQHLPNCDIERCPICGLQFLSCGCGEIHDIAENARQEDIERLIRQQVKELEEMD